MDRSSSVSQNFSWLVILICVLFIFSLQTNTKNLFVDYWHLDLFVLTWSTYCKDSSQFLYRFYFHILFKWLGQVVIFIRFVGPKIQDKEHEHKSLCSKSQYGTQDLIKFFVKKSNHVTVDYYFCFSYLKKIWEKWHEEKNKKSNFFI